MRALKEDFCETMMGMNLKFWDEWEKMKKNFNSQVFTELHLTERKLK